MTTGRPSDGADQINAIISTSGADATEISEAVPASDTQYRFDPERTAALFGQSLAALHRVEIPDGLDCLNPMDVAATARAHPVSVDSLDEAYRHISPQRLQQILDDSLPEVSRSDLVLTHGMATLNSLRCKDGRSVGFADWGDAAIADRHRDLAVAASSVASHLGPMAVPLFFEQYGERPNPAKLDWWALAAQLTPSGSTDA